MAVRFCPVLVGREHELADLRAALADARAGTAATRIIVGVAGVGKSRLVAELAAEAAAAGMATLTGRAVQSGRREAFRPVAEVLMAVLRTTNPADLAHLRPFRSAIGRLVPDWAEDKPAPEFSLVVLAEGVLRMLAAAAGQRGALLVVEDVHWSDPETLTVLEYLADNLRSERVLCVATMRPDPDTEAYAVARRLAARRSAAYVEVVPLSAPVVRRMARLCLDIEELPAALEPLVLARAEGLPLLVEDLLATAYESGVLRRSDGTWTLADEAARVIPRDFADTVRKRVALLGDSAGILLQAGAALGTAFDWRIAAEATAISAPTALAEFRRAVDVGLLRVDEGEGGPSFGFHHALTRDAVWSMLLAHERLRLSAAALEAVQARHPGLPGQWCDLAALLSERAGQAGHAASLLLLSGQRALARGALATAEQVLERAQSLAADLSLRTAVGETLTEVLSLAGTTDRAFATGSALLAELAELPETSEAQLRVHLCLARTAIGATRWADAGHHLRRARDLAKTRPDTALAARIDVLAAQVAMGVERLEDATALARSARATATPEVACEALIILGRRARLADLAAAGRFFTEAYELADRHALPYWSIQAMHELGTVEALSTGRLDRLRQAHDMALASGALATAAILDLQLAGAHHVRFEPLQGLEAAMRAAEGARRFRLGHALPVALVQAAGCHALAARRTDMEAALSQAESIASGDSVVEALAWGHCRGLLDLLQEDRAAAMRALDKAMGFIRHASGGPPGIFRGLWALVRTLQDPRHASAAQQEVRDSGVTTLPMNAAMVAYANAILLGHTGDTAGATSAFDAADSTMTSWEGHDGLWHLVRRLVAEAALRDGWGQPAMWLRQAATYFAGTPHQPVTSACHSLLRAAGQPVPRLARGEIPVELRARGVTGRETDVLALLGSRLSNKEIADRLVLSPRTIEKHVERLLAKTGLPDRLALAGLAMRLRLTGRTPDT
ncbi:AAA family ATPase [Acrocarpospora sp. B8E8]|uniref:helix-turn-helix transcriptional regulator n=1 Tax=Acrocarpospora sp. B8E8 TaxID=3153572 RepID=UPI00325EC69B